MKVLVTGANGYIGSKLCKYLCDNNINVIATDFKDDHIDNRCRYIKADIFEKGINWFDYFEKPDVCIHLAWRDGFIHNSKLHLEDLPKHYYFLENLIDNGLKHIACMGTMHEVGYWEGKIKEDTPCNPITLYGISKNALRNALKVKCENENIYFQWLRAFYIYGDDLFGNSIFCKIRQASSNGKKEFPFTTGESKYDFIEVDELVRQIALSIIQTKVLGIINVCSGTPISLKEKVEEYILNNNIDIKLIYGAYPSRKYDSPCLYGDNDKILEIMRERIYG